MIWNVKNSNGMMLIDERGAHINYAYEFNDETCEVKFFVTGKRGSATAVVMGGGKVIQASAIVPGARMVPKTPVVPE